MMKKTIAIVLLALSLQVSLAQELTIGDKAPLFSLTNIDGSTVALNDYSDKKGVIVIFTCNHCPYAKAYEDRIVQLQSKYGKDFPVVAINPNDAESYPDDNFEAMQIRAKEKGFNFPYLHDENQETAKAYGAKKTPHVYLLVKTNEGFEVVYIGAIDDNYTDASKVKKKYIEDAIRLLSEGKEVKVSTTAAVGCSIKWKKKK